MRQHLVAQHLLLEVLEDLLRLDLALDFALGERGDQLVEHLVDAVVVLELAADAHRLGQRHEHLLLDLAVEVVADLLLRDLQLLLAGLLRQVVDGGDDLLDRGVRRLERLDDLLLGHFLGAGLDHHEAVLAAGDDEIELALLALLEGRVDDVLAVDQADAHAGDRLLERESRRAASAADAPVIASTSVSFSASADSTSAMICVSKRQPDGKSGRIGRSMHAARQHFLFGRLAFALEEAAGDAARRVGVFAVVDRQRQEVDAFARVGRAAGRDEHDRVAVADDDGAVGLLGELAGFESESLAADGEFASCHKSKSLKFGVRSQKSDLNVALRLVYLRMFSRLMRSA